MTDASRISKLVGMLASDFEGERANAAAMLKKAADAEGKTIEELLKSVYGKPVEAPRQEAPHRRPDPENSRRTNKTRYSFKEKVALAAYHQARLTAWERNFIYSLQEQILRRPSNFKPSPSQRKVMVDIWAKVKP